MYQTHLILAPFSEAIEFPYLSLPALAAVLEAADLQVAQHDVNMYVIHALAQRNTLLQLKEQVVTRLADSVGRQIRIALIELALTYDSLWQEATIKQKSPVHEENQARAIRIITKILNLALELSALGEKSPSWNAAGRRIQTLIADDDQDDLLLSLLQSWVKKNICSTPAFIGISIPFYSQILPALALANLIKRQCPQSLLIWGGPQVWLHFDELMANAYLCANIDALCFGAGEPAILDLVRLAHAEDSSRPPLPNIRWIQKNANIITVRPDFLDQVFPDINRLPPPKYKESTLKTYLTNEVQLPLITCFGCYWGRCTFCSYGNRHHFAGQYQECTPDKLAENCIDLINKHKQYRINFIDENTNIKLVVKAMRLVRAKGYKIQFSIRNRLDKCLLDKVFCEELYHLGCVLMSVGYETNSQRLLDKLERGLNASLFDQIFCNLHEAGITVRVSVMGAILDETQDELEKSIIFLQKHKGRIGIDSTQKLVVEPMTPLAFDPSARTGFTLAKPMSSWNKLMNFGLGRIGHELIPERTGNYATEEQFATLIRSLEMNGNSEKRPRFESSALSISSKTKSKVSDEIQHVQLVKHYIAVPYQNNELLICDLSWQTFHKISTSHVLQAGPRQLHALSDRGKSILATLINQGVALITDSSQEKSSIKEYIQ